LSIEYKWREPKIAAVATELTGQMRFDCRRICGEMEIVEAGIPDAQTGTCRSGCRFQDMAAEVEQTVIEARWRESGWQSRVYRYAPTRASRVLGQDKGKGTLAQDRSTESHTLTMVAGYNDRLGSNFFSCSQSLYPKRRIS
jgi:hypothetical protein